MRFQNGETEQHRIQTHNIGQLDGRTHGKAMHFLEEAVFDKKERER